MAKKQENPESATAEESAVIAAPEQAEPLYRRGEAVPVDPATGAPANDAGLDPRLVDPVESTAINLSLQEGTAESKAPAHTGSHWVGGVTKKEEKS
jgi:hypothetical protein